LPDSPVTVDELADADVVAVTHAGYDHRAQAIDVTLAGNAVLVCGTALYGAALDAGVPAGRCAGIVSGVTFRHGDVTLKSLDARHTSNMTWRGQFVADELHAHHRRRQQDLLRLWARPDASAGFRMRRADQALGLITSC
jgi:L-ascorbate metabolism protein UlaG (beta-lactamase superfamily)